jgi:hypothetical protein
MDDMAQKLCDSKHADLDRRISGVETTLAENLKKLYDKIDEFGKRPTWSVSVIITVLSSSCVGLLVLALRR